MGGWAWAIFGPPVFAYPEVMTPSSLKPGMRVRVAQRVQAGASAGLAQYKAEVEGTILSCEAEPTSSWFAHGKNDRVWLLRLRLKKDDGEISALNLDDASVVTVLSLPDAERA